MSHAVITSPLLVEATRGFAPESSHVVHAVVTDGRGRLRAAYGDAERLTFPRSALKPLQAVALVESGAAEFFKVSDDELALACASHTGEEWHVAVALKWLKRLGLAETALECGPHAPYSAPAKKGTRAHNNCSGKHAGMLTLSLFLQADVKGYTDPRHPAQQMILNTLSDLCGHGVTPETCGIDGCSAPNPALSLLALAKGFGTFMTQEGFSPARAAACRRLMGAMARHSALIAGPGRLDTVVIDASGGKIMGKGGAEGVYAAIIPGENTVIVLKAEDGAPRAAAAAFYTLLEKHGLAAPAVLQALRPLCLPTLKNWAGIEIGTVRTKTA